MSSILPDRLLTNITINVPNSTTQHGNDHILCLPIAKNYWPSVAAVIIFFATNYLAHAATVKSSPGDDTLLQGCNALLALFFPMSGLLRALNAIVRLPIRARNELEKACKAGALCMVVRAPHWRPKPGQKFYVGVVLEDDRDVEDTDPEGQFGHHSSQPIKANMITYLPSYAREQSSTWVHFDSVWARSRVDLRLSRVHGTYDLPEGYEFAIVPRNTFLISQVASDTHGDPRLSSEISVSYSALKAVASLIQVVAAFTTLLSNRPDLISRWGYASYHLTVIPYLAMTLVNLISNVVSPDYSCLYMIRSETMVEAEKLGGRFEGEIAQMISLLPKDGMQVENPAWSGLTKEDLQKFSLKLTSTASEMYFFDLVTYLLDLITASKAKKKLSARDAEMMHLEVVSQLNASTTPAANESESSAAQANPPVDPTGEILPTGNESPVLQDVFFVDEFRTQSNLDILARPVGSTNEYQIQIPRPPRLSSGKGLSYTIHRVMVNLSSARAEKTSSFFAILQNMKENRKRLEAYKSSGSTSSYFKQNILLYNLALKDRIIPMSLDDNAEFAPVRSAIIYHPNCHRFLRWDDFANPPKSNKKKSNATQLRKLSPITDSEENYMAASISNVRTLLKLPGRPTTTTASIAELEELLYSPTIRRTSGRIGWAILVEISIGICVVGLFFGLIAGLTKFHSGESSVIERGIMMTWLASGLYGFCLPLLSTLELLKILFLFPTILSLYLSGVSDLYPTSHEIGKTLRNEEQSMTGDWNKRTKNFAAVYTKAVSKMFVATTPDFGPQPPAALLYVFAFIPLGIFIPPVWGFVLVGRMITEWGDCVRLY
ncbi:putative pogo transposable protein [Botrytis fragariae]|uniref:Putative pogo transposable protein n=1 Tax=Botrytis fragariae TaxID=1964551 RepID=A0A8H6ANZ3_9HELO|nr:putative pogo transposable protein [Botrytis fragariae]KAF5870861.1 putative pogo transposable protein [Botrytis fragariae]